MAPSRFSFGDDSDDDDRFNREPVGSPAGAARRRGPSPQRPAGPVPILSPEDLRHGVIARIIPLRGFGFIAPDPSDGTEFFFHLSVVRGGAAAFEKLTVGTPVQFQAMNAAKGPRAVMVRKVEK